MWILIFLAQFRSRLGEVQEVSTDRLTVTEIIKSHMALQHRVEQFTVTQPVLDSWWNTVEVRVNPNNFAKFKGYDEMFKKLL